MEIIQIENGLVKPFMPQLSQGASNDFYAGKTIEISIKELLKRKLILTEMGFCYLPNKEDLALIENGASMIIKRGMDLSNMKNKPTSTHYRQTLKVRMIEYLFLDIEFLELLSICRFQREDKKPDLNYGLYTNVTIDESKYNLLAEKLGDFIKYAGYMPMSKKTIFTFDKGIEAAMFALLKEHAYKQKNYPIELMPIQRNETIQFLRSLKMEVTQSGTFILNGFDYFELLQILPSYMSIKDIHTNPLSFEVYLDKQITSILTT